MPESVTDSKFVESQPLTKDFDKEINLQQTPKKSTNTPNSPKTSQITHETRKQKWKIGFCCMCYRFLTDGVEYAIVIPTLHDYLRENFNQDVRYTGIVLSCYAMGGLVSAPVMGYLSDKMGSGRNLLIIGCFLSVIGNLLYFSAPKKEFVALGRFIAGIGIDPIVLAEIGRVDHLSQDQKSTHISIVYTMRQVGVLLGPLCVLIIGKTLVTEFDFMGVTISHHNCGGLICSFLYLASAISFILFYQDEYFKSYNPVKDLENLENSVNPVKSQKPVNLQQKSTTSVESKQLQRVENYKMRLIE